MEDNFNHDDFEEFLQDQVRNHRIYPTDAVWREIDKKLHGEKRWPALTIAAALLVGVTVLICVYFTPKPNIFSIPTATVNTAKQTADQKNNLLNNLAPASPFAKEKSTSSKLATSDRDAATKGLPTASEKVHTTPAAMPGILPAKTNPAGSVHLKSSARQKVRALVQNKPAEVPAEMEMPDGDNGIVSKTESASLAVAGKEVKANKSTVTGPTAAKDYNDKNVVDEFLQDHKSDIPLHTASKKINLKKQFSYQIYVAPSVSYRKLLEDNSLPNDNNAGPIGLNYVADVNKVVRHKPGTGIEAGVAIMYNLSNKVRIKSGFQFNMRQYSIEAYRSSTELASIALRVNNGFDTVNTLAIYRNNNGYYSAQLVNRYYQLSVPLGIEWEIVGNKFIALNVAGTIQPTYLLNRNAYLLSTNFKNYTESPDMIRQWNINSNVEAFVSMKVGDFKWQLGPQLRYQPYSTFIPEYTIKEHLMDYGLKLGVSKTIK